MVDEKTKVMQGNAHRFFWLYILIFFVILVVMISFTSFSQERMKQEKDQISEQLTEEKNYSKGIQETIQDISEENDRLKQENQSLQEKITNLQEENQKLRQENSEFIKNKETLQKLKEAYVAGDRETAQQLMKEIKEDLIDDTEIEQYKIIKQDLEEK